VNVVEPEVVLSHKASLSLPSNRLKASGDDIRGRAGGFLSAAHVVDARKSVPRTSIAKTIGQDRRTRLGSSVRSVDRCSERMPSRGR
jgi:hypothetical protein